MEDRDDQLNAEEEFTEKELFAAWEQFFKKEKNHLADFEIMVLRKKPVLRENHVLDVMIQNGIEINILKKMEDDLLKFLRTALKNNKISINHVRLEEPSEEKLYTDSDKFNDMVKRNPVLLTLKDKLGLDTEY